MENSCCFTGYRPDKFSFPLEFGNKDFNDFENKLYDAIFSKIQEGVHTFYCGMAMGFDLLAGKTVVNLKRMRNDCRLVAVIPFAEQSGNFPPAWKSLYEIVLKEADEVVHISDKYTKSCFAIRNRFMVDRASKVITYYDGKSGGTGGTLKYAISKNRQITNIYEYDLSGLYNNYVSYEADVGEY